MHIYLKHKVRGGALYYALFVMLILSSSGLLIVSLLDINRKEEVLFYKQVELKDLIESARTYVASNPACLFEREEGFSLDVFGDDKSVVHVERHPWGFMHKLTFFSKWKKVQRRETSLLAGRDENKIALWMPDRRHYLSLVGESFIKGDCFLSVQGVRAGTVDGRHFEGTCLHKGKSYVSQGEIPRLRSEIIDLIDTYLLAPLSKGDSIISYDHLGSHRNLIHPFDKQTLVVYTQGDMIIDRGSFVGNMIMISTKRIEVWPTATIKDCILISPQIVIKDGFVGRGQFLANNHITVGRECVLNYPSFVAAISHSHQVSVSIGEETSLKGAAVCYSLNPPIEDKPLMKTEHSSIVFGKLYTNGDFDIGGNVKGGVICDRFVHKTPRAFYENFIVDCSIDALVLPNDFASFCLGEIPYELEEVQTW